MDSRRLDPFTLLERSDKWYLGGGGATLYAPTFPRWLDTPGFWDETYFADIRLERLFGLLLWDKQGHALTLTRVVRRWTPDCLTHIYTIEGYPNIQLQEERVVTARDTFASHLTLINSGPEPTRFHLLLWSLQQQQEWPPADTAATIADVEREPDALSFAWKVHYGETGETPAEVYGWGARNKSGESGQSSVDSGQKKEPHAKAQRREEKKSGQGSVGSDQKERAEGTPASRPQDDWRNASQAGTSVPDAVSGKTDGFSDRVPDRQPTTDNHQLFIALGGSRLPDSWTINLAEMTDTSPLWQVSIFPEKFRNGMLAQETQDNVGWNPNGLLHLALHYILETPPGETETITLGASVALQREEALDNLREDLSGDVVKQSRAHWESYFASVPNFLCSDPYLERAYWYRWYGLHLNTVSFSPTKAQSGDKSGQWSVDSGQRKEPHAKAQSHEEESSGQSSVVGDQKERAEGTHSSSGRTVSGFAAPETGRLSPRPEDGSFIGPDTVAALTSLPYPSVFEGIGAFRSHISYSAQCHIRETSWMQDLTLAKGCLLNFLHNQVRHEGHPNDGFLPGHLYLWRQDRGFYHADWGATALQIYHLTGDLNFIRQVYPGLVRYAEYFDRERDGERSGLYDVLDQGETGQEYMSRYLFVDEFADQWHKIQVKGVDSTCYLYSLQRALAVFARALANEEDALWWDEKADTTADAICDLMWDREARLFKDVHPQTFALSPYKAAVGFYPFLTDIAGPEHLAALEHLSDPKTFGTPYPIPASSVDDPTFDAQGGWKGKRTNCPWNGRVWPMTSSHVVEAFAHAARTLDRSLRPAASDLLYRFVKMLFHDGDPKRPNCYEHYNPYTGTPSLYRGVDDYQHSWIVHLILSHVAGIQTEPGEGGTLVIDPLPLGLDWFLAEDIRVRGHRVDVFWGRLEGLIIKVDGIEKIRQVELERVEIPL